MSVTTPEWVKSAIFYQIFPDRFCKGSVSHLPAGIQLKPWGTPAREQGFQGGDLYGIIDKLDYLHGLGITAIYLNPIFASAANHRYHTYDYFQVDPLLGGEAAFRELLDRAHEKGIRVMLDGVFNHASRGFWAFHHILEEGVNSPYLDWFHIEDWPLNPYPDQSDAELNYRGWWNLPALPKFNTDNPGVRDYLLSVADYWAEFGIDGWRLDVPQEIDDDAFWQTFRQRVKTINPELYICGEIWDKADRWLKGDQFDGVMNYPLGCTALSYFGADTLNPNYEQDHLDLTPCNSKEFKHRVEEVFSWYDEAINQVQLNLLDSHDTARALWILSGDVPRLRLALAFMLSIPGAPCIYYGTEIGMSGGTDPDCREAFPWDNQAHWELSLTDTLRKQAWARQRFPALGKGRFALHPVNEDLVIIERTLSADRVLVVLNRSAEPQKIPLRSEWEALLKLDGNGEMTKQSLSDQSSIGPFGCETFVS